jgi:hypothetical protein
VDEMSELLSLPLCGGCQLEFSFLE